MEGKNCLYRPKDPVYEAMMMAKWDGLVKKLAVRYGFLGDFDDVAQNGRIGLLYAIRYFDESKGVPFQKVAQLMIRTYMLGEYHKNGKVIRGGKEIGCPVELSSDMTDYDIADTVGEQKNILDEILSEAELDGMVLNRAEYDSLGHGVGYSKSRKEARKKIEAYKSFINN